MNNILIRKKEKNTYEIKLFSSINIYNLNALQNITKEIIAKIKKKYTLRREIVLDIYPSKYETIIILKDYNKFINININTEVKINIHTSTIFLYEIDYYDINLDNYKVNIYYYKNKFYLKIKDITEKEYIKLTEYTTLIYQDTDEILDNSLKIKI